MLLAFNTIITGKYKIGFDQDILPLIMQGFPYKIVHLDDDNLKKFQLDETVFSRFTHLLLSGSSLSASQGSEYDQIIMKVIRYFLKRDRAILGICHGHQMLTRAILGNVSCRRTENPEFGWRKINIKPNQLFKGITNPVFLESHYDEVCNLNEDFKIIATNDDCRVQAFQYKKRPVWGVQFHPEMLYDSGTKMVNEHLAGNPQDKQYYLNDLRNKIDLQQNLKIFENFVSS